MDKDMTENECFSNFKDGVSDGVLIGVKSDSNHNHYYKLGYDYGITLYCELLEEEDIDPQPSLLDVKAYPTLNALFGRYDDDDEKI